MNQVIDILIQLLVVVPVLVLAISVHEFMHSYTAYKLGDYTQKSGGRLTLNPLAHLNPPLFIMYILMFLGFLPTVLYYAAMILAMVFLSRFGPARPVGVNPRYFKNPKVGMGISALAGPLSNFAMAFVAMLIFAVISFFMSRSGAVPAAHTVQGSFASAITMVLGNAISINITLGVFNLLPLPPLDGYRVVCIFLPNDIVYKISRYEQFGIIIVYILLAFGLLQGIISKLTGLIWNLMDAVISFLPL